LLRQLKDLERQFGRGDKVVRNAPRELDLDLLVFDEETRDTETFNMPQPPAVERLFVLAPVAEIAPELGWPGIGKTIRELLLILETDEQVTALDCHISSA
jgi:7,8-dihydro-6-hydroxymethylpterin-pyrophosphokinase